VLADDAMRFHKLLHHAGVVSILSLIPGMEHVAVTRSRALPGAEETFMAMCGFVSARLESQDPRHV